MGKIKDIETKISVLEGDQSALKDLLNIKKSETLKEVRGNVYNTPTNEVVNSSVENDVANFCCNQCDRIFNS